MSETKTYVFPESGGNGGGSGMMIRETVKEAMKLRNVKSKDLAEHVEVTKSTMSLFLNGKTNLGQEKIEKILDFLDIKLVITK